MSTSSQRISHSGWPMPKEPKSLQDRSHGVVSAIPEYQDASLFPPQGFFAIFIVGLEDLFNFD